MAELEHIIASCSGEDPLPLFRGHSDYKWLLDSTFARTCKRILFQLPPDVKLSEYVKASVVYHRTLLNLLLLKFGTLVRPTQELDAAEVEHGIDAWFELLRRFQQFPEEDHPYLRGTFILDWTKSKDIALFFANQDRKGDGALWICDAAATGKTRPVKKVGEILDLMNKIGNSGEALGSPLIFYPEKQIRQERANNQDAVYIAQMDLRYDLSDIWRAQEAERSDECIYVKLVLPSGTQDEVTKYLLNKGITESWIYPD